MTSMAVDSSDARKAELVLAQLDALPPLAPIAARILALADDSNTHARQIIELVSADPALTARVLSIVGKAEHGFRAKSVTIDTAVKMLGFKAIRQITLTLKVMDAFGSGPDRAGTQPEEAPAFDRSEFWKHCLAAACAARRIAMKLPNLWHSEEAFVGGLLHDIGKIAIETAMPKAFERIVRQADRERADIADVERALLGVDHAVVGHRLADKWNLPAPLAECIWLHHQHPEGLPASIAAKGHVQIVQLADTIAREQRIGYSGNYQVAISSRTLGSRLGLSESALAEIAESLVDEIAERAAWIGEESLNTRAVYLHALMQTNEELAAANAELGEQRRRLERERVYFSAVGRLSRNVTPKSRVSDVCGVGAAALRDVLDRQSAYVFALSEDGRWIEWASAGARIQSGLEECTEVLRVAHADLAAAVELSSAGVWLAPPVGTVLRLAERSRSMIGTGPVWLFPIVRERRWVAGALFTASSAEIGALRVEVNELESLSGAIGLAVEQAQSRAAAVRLSDELAEVNRRLGTVESELVAARNLEAIVSFAAGAAHELNNPLAVISGRAQGLLRREDRPDVRESLEIIARQSHACSGIVTELMEFARSATPKPDRIDMRSCVDQVVAELASAGLLEEGQIRVDISSDTRFIHFDADHLRGIFRELLKNAIEATDPTSRRLSIKDATDSSEDEVVMHLIDNGRGMTTDVLDRAMEPFFSVRPAGRGRGLGLARVRRWLQQGGGRIRLDSEPGKGTIVELRFRACVDQ
ncbi:MAG: HDOD domain-containing protein [Phycisphaerae bacterium]|nr:HDOD domain-containing protein [Phycisphaerae bacterium]